MALGIGLVFFVCLFDYAFHYLNYCRIITDLYISAFLQEKIFNKTKSFRVNLNKLSEETILNRLYKFHHKVNLAVKEGTLQNGGKKKSRYSPILKNSVCYSQ